MARLVLSVFTSIFLYGVIPACIVWCILLTVLFFTYVFKGCIFLATGTASIVGATGSLAMVPAKIETVMGVALTIVSIGVAVLYRYFTRAPREPTADDVELSYMVPFNDAQVWGNDDPVVIS